MFYNRFTSSNLAILEDNLKTCNLYMTLLHCYKSLLIGLRKPLKSAKMHNILHLVPTVKNFGCMLGLDTETYEAYLKYSGKRIYRISQKRRVGTEAIMFKKVSIFSYYWLLICIITAFRRF